MRLCGFGGMGYSDRCIFGIFVVVDYAKRSFFSCETSTLDADLDFM